ncbi:Mutator family transposase [Brevibacillus invocatus]
MIYTTNIVEAYHRQLRKITKTKTAYPTDDALRKIIYLATMDITKKWTIPVRDWAQCISQFAILFHDRLSIDIAM